MALYNVTAQFDVQLQVGHDPSTVEIEEAIARQLEKEQIHVSVKLPDGAFSGSRVTVSGVSTSCFKVGGTGC
jgi:hypothetical protein